jgi:hypothetical protein
VINQCNICVVRQTFWVDGNCKSLRGNFQRGGGRFSFFISRRPHRNCAAVGYLKGMNTLLIIVVLLLLFGGGGFYFGGPVIGGSGLGLILLICLIAWVLGGFRSSKS